MPTEYETYFWNRFNEEVDSLYREGHQMIVSVKKSIFNLTELLGPQIWIVVETINKTKR